MKINIKKELCINKIIIFILVILMILPFTISIFGVSLAKIATIIMFFIVSYLVYTRKYEIKEILKNKFVIMNLFFSTSIIICLIFNYNSIHFNDLYEILRYIIFASITMTILMLCKEKSNYIFLLKAINIITIVICIFGIIQYFNPFSINELYIKSYAPTQYSTLVENYDTPRIVGTKANPSMYGMLIAITIYFNIIYYKFAKKKFLPIIAIILGVINLMMTLTRTIQIAFICSIIIFVLIYFLLKKGWKKAIIATVMSIVCLILIICILPKSLTWRLTQVLDFSNASSWIGRIEKWKNYIEIIKQNMIFGIGPVKNHIDILGYIDSEIIQIALQYGIIGSISYLLLLLSPIYTYIKEKNKKILRYYIPILVIILINAITSASITNYESAIPFYMMTGVIMVNNREKNKGE